MSGTMSPALVEAALEDQCIRIPSLMSPLLSLSDKGVAVPSAAPAMATVDVVRDTAAPTANRQLSSSSSTEERGDKLSPAPPAALQSPSVSAMSAPTYLKDQIISFFQVSDNKLAMKLFGNKTALMREKLRQRAVGNWVIHPCSNFRQVFCLDVYIICHHSARISSLLFINLHF